MKLICPIMEPSRNSQYEHCSAHITGLAQDGFFLKIFAQIPSDSVISGRELMSRIEQISGHLRRIKSCEAVSRDQLAFARIDDNFHRVQALADSSDGRVRVKFIDYGHDDWMLLSNIVVVESPLADLLRTYRPLAEEFFLDGVSLLSPLSTEESVLLREKIVFQNLACRLRRLHPELSLIEIATVGPSGETRSLSNSIIESGYGKKCTTEDIAKFLRIKLPSRVEEVVMQPSRQYTGLPAQFTMPPPGIAIQHQPNVVSAQMIQQAKTSANSRLVRYNKADSGPVSNSGAVSVYGPPHQAVVSPPPLADRKQYTVTDGSASCMLAQPLPVNSSHQVYISHIEDGPYNFCLQLKSSVEEVLPKLKNILARYQNAAPINATLMPGAVVMARGSDDTLRRAITMKLNPDMCNVYYIDYGNNENRPYSDIFQLPNTAAELSPAMAMQFCLANIDSIKITDANKEYFARLLLGKQVGIRVTESPRPPFQYCELVWEGRSMLEILVNLNSPMQYSYHQPPSSKDTKVSVVYAEGPEQFYVQYIKELDTINQIQETLEAYCRKQPCLTDIDSIYIGSPVAAIFPDDKKWYRALVMGIVGSKIRVYYVDYGNRTEVSINQMCLLSRDLVTKWPSQAVACCLIGFDTVSPALYLVEKMEDTVLGHTYKLKLNCILSGFRLYVDLIDDQGNSIAAKMKAVCDEKHKSTSTETQRGQPPSVEKKKQTSPKPQQDDDRASLHSNDSSGGKSNKFQRPPLKADRERSDRGNKPEQRNDRNKFEEKSKPFSQHDDRAENTYKQQTDSRSDWKKGAKKPYMDQADVRSNTDMESTFHRAREDKSGDNGGRSKKVDWRNHSNETNGDKPGWGTDNARGNQGDRNDKGRGWNNNRFDRKPIPSGASDENKNSEWGSKDRKFGGYKVGDRENRPGKPAERSNLFGERGNRFGDNEFGDAGNKSGDRGAKFERGRFGDRENRDQKQRWNNERESKPKTSAAAKQDIWDDESVATAAAAAKWPSVVISEYPRQPIVAGQEYKVLFAGMDAPNDVYVQLEDSDPVLNKIRALIDADKTSSARPIPKPVLGMPVLAKFDDDELLYRALIKSLSKTEKGQVDVIFVDFGNSAVVALSDVYSVPAELMEIPIQAIHVMITDLPKSFTGDLNAIQAHFLDNTLTLKPSSTMVVNMVQCAQGTLHLPDGKSIAEAIKNDPICAGAQSPVPAPTAVASSGEPEKTPERSADTWVERLDLLIGQTISAKIIEKLETDKYLLQVTACLGLVVPVRSVDPHCSDLTTGEEVIVRITALSKDELLAKYFDKNGKNLSGGSSISPVCPLPVVKRKSIFMICHKEQEFVYLQRDDSGGLLLGLLTAMFDHYYENEDVPKDKFHVGDICAAQSVLDENWYRAKIEGVNEVYTVRYVDYGNTEELPFDKARILDDKFTSPELCVRVALPVCYTDLEGCFASLASDDPYECTFITKDEVRDCWIIDLSSVGANENFALQWIKEKKAGFSSIPADPRLREPGWDLKKGDSIPIVVTHVDSLDSFWVQFSDYLTDIDALQSKLQELPDSDSSELGEIFVAKYADDGLWYRAIHCGNEVRFIDYGNTDPAQERKKLPEDLIYPVKGYALPLKLCVKPAGPEWSAEAKKAFDAFIEREDSSPDDFKKAEIVSVDFEILVDLKCGNDLLSSILISGGHAVPFGTKDEKLEAKMVQKEVLEGTVPEATEKPQAVINEDEVPGDTVPGVVTSAVSINDFYFQLDSKTDAIDELADRLLAADAFEVVEDPAIGDYVIAKFTEDLAWYRAKVVSKPPHEVLFVDYGNTSLATEFRKLPLDLAAPPLLAWHCTADNDDTAVNEMFMNLVDEGSPFEVSFTGTQDGKHLVLVSVDGESIDVLKLKKDTTANISSKSDPKPDSTPEDDTTPNPEPSAESQATVQAPAKDETKDSNESLPLPASLGKLFYKDCILVHSNGPYDFYVQTDDDHIQVEEMANALFEAGNFPKLDSVKKGDFVVAQYPEDDAYYRAVVVEEDPAVVHFTDYGNSCPVTCFHEMPVEIKKVPQLAVRCSLQSPPGGWSADAIDQFTTLLNPDTKSIDLKILTRGDPNIVDVFISGSSLTQKLAPNAELPPNSVQDIPQPHQSPDQETDQLPEVSTSTQNEEFSVTLSYAVSPSEFYYHKDEEKVSLLATRLMTANELKPIENCEVGQLICAKYSEDELWYRAKVLSTGPVKVFFIDYGNDSEVLEFRELPEDLSVIPPLAVKASLRPQEQAWTPEETEKFLDVAYSGEMKCSIIEEKSDLTILRLIYQDGDMITFLGRSSSVRNSASEYGTPPGSLASIESMSASDLLTSVAEALKSNRELQDTLDARLATEDLLASKSVLAQENTVSTRENSNTDYMCDPSSSSTSYNTDDSSTLGPLQNNELFASADHSDLDLSVDNIAPSAPADSSVVSPLDECADISSLPAEDSLFLNIPSPVDVDVTATSNDIEPAADSSIYSAETPQKLSPSADIATTYEDSLGQIIDAKIGKCFQQGNDPHTVEVLDQASSELLSLRDSSVNSPPPSLDESFVTIDATFGSPRDGSSISEQSLMNFDSTSLMIDATINNFSTFDSDDISNSTQSDNFKDTEASPSFFKAVSLQQTLQSIDLAAHNTSSTSESSVATVIDCVAAKFLNPADGPCTVEELSKDEQKEVLEIDEITEQNLPHSRGSSEPSNSRVTSPGPAVTMIPENDVRSVNIASLESPDIIFPVENPSRDELDEQGLSISDVSTARLPNSTDSNESSGANEMKRDNVEVIDSFAGTCIVDEFSNDEQSEVNIGETTKEDLPLSQDSHQPAVNVILGNDDRSVKSAPVESADKMFLVEEPSTDETNEPGLNTSDVSAAMLPDSNALNESSDTTEIMRDNLRVTNSKAGTCSVKEISNDEQSEVSNVDEITKEDLPKSQDSNALSYAPAPVVTEIPENDDRSVRSALIESTDTLIPVEEPMRDKPNERKLNLPDVSKAKLPGSTDLNEFSKSRPPLPTLEPITEGKEDLVKKCTPVKSSPSSPGTPKKPVKTVAEIKAQAKSRIFGPSGLPSVTKRATAPSLVKKPQRHLSPSQSSPASPSKEDRIIPGCVLGNN